MDLVDKLRQKMSEQGLNSSTLAQKSGVPQPTIYRILNGESTDPRTTTVTKLAQALSMTELELRGINKEGLTPEEVKGLSAWRTLSSGVTPEEIKVLSALRELSTEEQEHVRKLIDLLMKSGKSSA
mgnify:CR=1 FL=1